MACFHVSKMMIILMNSINWETYGLDYTNLLEEPLHGYGKMVVTLIKSSGPHMNLTTKLAKMKIVAEYNNIWIMDLLTNPVVGMVLIVNVKFKFKTNKCAYLNKIIVKTISFLENAIHVIPVTSKSQITLIVSVLKKLIIAKLTIMQQNSVSIALTVK